MKSNANHEMKAFTQLMRKFVHGKLKGKAVMTELARTFFYILKPWFQTQLDLEDTFCAPLKPTLETGYRTVISDKWGYGRYHKFVGSPWFSDWDPVHGKW